MLQKQYIFWANYFHSQTECFHVFSLNLGHSQLTIGVCWKCNCWKHCHAGTLAMWSSGGQNPSKYRRGEQSPSPFWKRPVAHPDWLTELAVSAMFHLQAWGKKSPVTSISLCGSCCANASGHGDDALRNATATSMRRAKGSVEQAWADFLWGDGILSASLYSYLVMIWTILHCQARNWWQIGCDFFDLTSEICSKARKAPARTLPGSTFLAETAKWSSI